MSHLAVRVLDPRLGDQFELPTYSTPASAGLDLRAMIDAPLQLAPGETALVPSGLAVHIADPNFAGIVLPRSGLGHRYGVVLGNGTGLIDADYQGPLMISLFNRSRLPYQVAVGERVAQLVIVPIARVSLAVVDAFEPSMRASGGFGHTGSA